MRTTYFPSINKVHPALGPYKIYTVDRVSGIKWIKGKPSQAPPEIAEHTYFFWTVHQWRSRTSIAFPYYEI